MSRSVTSPSRTSAPSKARRFAATAPAVSGSMSTASTFMPRPAIAMASDPMPQPRSATRVAPQSLKRCAWRAATTRRVACSRPSRVNTMWEANGPNFERAAWRRASWVRTATTSSASRPEARRADPSSGSGMGLVACFACRDSSSSQPGEDRMGVRALTRSLSHLSRDEAEWGLRSGRGRRLAQGERAWHSACPSARIAPTLVEEAREHPRPVLHLTPATAGKGRAPS